MKDLQYKIILILISILSFFSNLWVEQADLMESRNFITAREMVISGNWLYPTLNGAYRFEKPPFPTWWTALVMKITGNITDEWVLRIPVALLSLFLVLWMYKFIKRLTENNFLAFVISVVFSTSFFIMKEGAVNSWDMFSYALSFGAVTYLIEGFYTGRKIDYVKSGILLGMSIMSKGPVAIYGLLVPFCIGCGIVYGCESFKKNWKQIIFTIILGIVIATIWPLTMILANKELFFKVMVKESKTWSEKFIEGYFYYCDYIVFTGGWIFFSLGAIIYPWSKKRITSENKKIFDFGILTTLLTLILLSLIKMKKQRYGLPIYIASSIPTGTLIYSYYMMQAKNKIRDAKYSLTKVDTLLFCAQSYVLKIILFVMPIIYYIYGVKTEHLSIVLFLFLSICYYFILGIYLCLLRIEKEFKIQTTLVFTAFVIMFFHITANGFIEERVRQKEKQANYLSLEEFGEKKIELKIYADAYKIEDVWNIGNPINNIIDEKGEIKRELPDSFLYFTDKEKNGEEFGDFEKVLFEKYKVKKIGTFYRFERNNSIVELYELEKKGE